MDWAGSLGGAVVIVVAMVEVLKRSSVGRWVPDRDWGLVAIGLGVVFTYLIAAGVPDNEMGEAHPAAIVICGIIAGLAASGALNTAKAQTHRGEAEPTAAAETESE